MSIHHQIKEYITHNQSRFIQELVELLKIPSVSAAPEHKNSMQAAANFTLTKLKDAGLDKVELCPTSGNPIVYAEKIVDKNLPTVLIYGHYDVQPADPLELWHSPPFEPVIKEDKIYARGAADDKGQFYMHVKALELLIAQNMLSCNVKVLIEGEEEIGSNSLASFVVNNKEKLKADVILISDTSMIASNIPSVTVGLRGLSYVEVELTAANRDLHSGVYGGAVANPINVLCQMIASLKDADGKITIPGFYDKVLVLSTEERKELAKIPFDLDQYKADLNIKDVLGEENFSTIERTSIRPTLDVNGIWGGYIGEGAKTVLPSKAFAKISMRLVPNQKSEEITELFTQYFQSLAPNAVTVSVRPHHGGEAVVTPTNTHAYKSCERAFELVWGKTPIATREGGSIPVVALFEQELNIHSILMGFGLNSDAIHSPNEHFLLSHFIKGIETISMFFHLYSEKK